MTKKFFRSVNANMVTLEMKILKNRAARAKKYSRLVGVPKTNVKVDWKNDGNERITRVAIPFSVNHKTFGPLTVFVKEVQRDLDLFSIELKNSFKKVFSRETLMIEPKYKRIRGISISTEKEYRATKTGRKHGFGELIRLTSIMEMLENKCKSISIFAKNTAIFFHGKYKFQPNISDKKEAGNALLTVINDKSPDFKRLSLRAKKLHAALEKIETMSNEEKTKLFKKINNLLNQYVKKALAEGKNGLGHEFDNGMSMILTEGVVQKQRGFFNKKFKNHGIDYKIKNPQ